MQGDAVSVDEIVSLYAQTYHDAGVNLVWPMAWLDLDTGAQQAGGKWYVLSKTGSGVNSFQFSDICRVGRTRISRTDEAKPLFTLSFCHLTLL